MRPWHGPIRKRLEFVVSGFVEVDEIKQADDAYLGGAILNMRLPR